jgi:hypothetical protein
MAIAWHGVQFTKKNTRKNAGNVDIVSIGANTIKNAVIIKTSLAVKIARIAGNVISIPDIRSLTDLDTMATTSELGNQGHPR